MRSTPNPTAALLILIAALLIGGCGLLPGNPGGELAGTSWTLERYAGTDLIPDTAMTAAFQDGEVRGSAGCNSFFGDYRAAGTDLAITGLAWTEMACLNPEGLMAQESEIMRLLGSAVSFQVEGDRLIIQTEKGQELIFRAQPDK